MTLPTIMLPGDEAHLTDDYTAVIVIASQWGNDDPDDGPVWFVALLLHPNAPYYEVVEYTWRPAERDAPGHWVESFSHGHAANINDAVRLYAENGGDN